MGTRPAASRPQCRCRLPRPSRSSRFRRTTPKDDVLAAFRREAKKAHPDLGGTAEMFTALVKARDRLLAALGTNAPAPKPPTYAPKGVPIVYRPIRSSGPARLGSTKLLG
jgi:hypothetical protein